MSPRFCLVLCALPACVCTSSADVMAPFPIPERVVRADLVVAGKVTKIEQSALSITPIWGGGKKMDHLVALVKVSETIKGKAKLTHVKVAFRPPAQGGLRRYPGIKTHLEPGEEVCLFLTAHPKETVHFFPYYFDRIDKRSPKQFEQQVKTARACAKLLQDPEKSLTSKIPRDRSLTAAMLLMRYRTVPRFRPPGSTVQQEPISAQQSKLLLTTLLESDWKQPLPELQPTHSPLNLFYQLGLSKADGWVAPKDFRKRTDAARQWLEKNAATYRIKKYVVVKPKN